MTGSIKSMGSSEIAGDYYIKQSGDEVTFGSLDEDSLTRKRGTWVDPSGKFSGFVADGEAVEPADFKKLIRGIDPRTGKALVKGAGVGRATGMDWTMSAPKELSVVWSQATDAQRKLLEAIMLDASREAFAAMNAYASASRAGAAGYKMTEATYVGAAFLDFTSRPVDGRGDLLPDEKEYFMLHRQHQNENRPVFIDPQLHVHFVVPNLEIDEQGNFRGIDQKRLMAAQSVVFETFHASLAHKLKMAGFDIRKEADKVAFGIAGIDKEVCEQFSKRTQAIESAKDKYRENMDLAPDADIGYKAAKRITLGTRNETLQNVTREEILEHWTTRGDAYGFGQFEAQDLFKKAEQRVRDGIKEEKGITEDDLKSIVEKIHEHEAVFSEHKLRSAVLATYTGKHAPADIHAAVDQFLQSQAVICLNEHKKRDVKIYSTAGMLKTELDILKSCQAKHRRAFDDELTEKTIERVIQSGKPLSQKQADAIRYICNNSNMISVLEGRAGSGKSFTSEGVRETFEAAGYKTYGTSLGWNASGVLRAEGGIKSIAALEPLVIALRNETIKLDEKSIVFIDEAGQVGSRHLAEVCKYAQEAGAKVVLMGDTKQISAVAAGSPLSAVVKEMAKIRADGQGSFTLDEVRRQKAAWDCAAGLKISEGDIKGAIEDYLAHDRFIVASTQEEAVKNLFEKYKSSFGNGTSLMIAKTNKDVSMLNAMAREMMIEKGLVQGSIKIPTYINSKKGEILLGVGDKIQFREKANAETSKKYDDLIVNRATGKILEINGKGANAVLKVQLYSGDKLTDRVVEVKLDDFRTKGKGYPLDYAYCMTFDSSQGQTFDNSFIVGNGIDRGKAYVGCTRHRHNLTIAIDKDNMHAYATRNLDADAFLDRNDFTDDMALKTLAAQWFAIQKKAMVLDYMDEIEMFAKLEEIRGLDKCAQSAEKLAEVKVAGLMEEMPENIVQAAEKIIERARAKSEERYQEFVGLLPQEPAEEMEEAAEAEIGFSLR